MTGLFPERMEPASALAGSSGQVDREAPAPRAKRHKVAPTEGHDSGDPQSAEWAEAPVHELDQLA
ncbi:MAG TPA: hypothetical protein VGG46_00520 [Terriglobales bacterium]|jgi:hypothetical protein